MNLIEKIKELFNNVELNFKDAKTVDGVILKITEDLVEGAKVEIVAEDGSLTPANGELKLEDGTVLQVENGVIASIVKAEEVPVEAAAEEVPAETELAEEAPVAPAEEVAADVTVDYEARVAELESRVASLEEAVMMLVDKIGQSQMAVTAAATELEVVKAENLKLSKQPAVAPVKTQKFEKTEVVTSSNKKSIDRISALLENNIDPKSKK